MDHSKDYLMYLDKNLCDGNNYSVVIILDISS